MALSLDLAIFPELIPVCLLPPTSLWMLLMSPSLQSSAVSVLHKPHLPKCTMLPLSPSADPNCQPVLSTLLHLTHSVLLTLLMPTISLITFFNNSSVISVLISHLVYFCTSPYLLFSGIYTVSYANFNEWHLLIYQFLLLCVSPRVHTWCSSWSLPPSSLCHPSTFSLCY